MDKLVRTILTVCFVLNISACGGGDESDDNGPITPVNIPPNIASISSVEVASEQSVTIVPQVDDSDGTIDNFEWQQTSGQGVSFDSSQSELTFNTPDVSVKSELVFSLTVTDNDGATASSEVSIVVYPTSIGKIIGMPESGIKYQGALTAGEIDSTGNFIYTELDLIGSIHFTLGGIELGLATPNTLITALELMPHVTSADNFSVINLNTFLFSLDNDCQISNGIQLNESIISIAEEISFNFRTNESNLINETELNDLLNLNECADSWLSSSEAQIKFDQLLTTTLEAEFSSLVAFTPIGEPEPSILYDGSGSLLTVLDGDPSQQEKYRILYSVNFDDKEDDEILAVSIGLDGLPQGLYTDDGTRVVFDNFTTTTVDMVIYSEGEAEQVKRIELPTAAQQLLLSIAPDSSVISDSRANDIRYKETHLSKNKQLSSRNNNSNDEVVKKLEQAVTSIKLVKSAIDIDLVAQSHILGKTGGILSYTQNDLKTSFIDTAYKMSLKASGLSEDHQQAILLALSASKCATDVYVWDKLNDCLDVMVGTAKNLATLKNIYDEIQDDKDRIAELKRVLEEQRANFQGYPPVVNIQKEKIENKYPRKVDINFIAWVKDADEDITTEQIVWYWDGEEIGRGERISYQHEYDGKYTIEVVVTDSTGKSNSDSMLIEVGNLIPEVTIDEPTKTLFLCSELPLTFRGSAIDAEDGVLDSSIFDWSVSNTGAVMDIAIDEYIQINFPCPGNDVYMGRQTHYLTLKAKDSIGQEGDDFKNIIISNSDIELSLQLGVETGSYQKGENVNLVALAEVNGELADEQLISWRSSIDGQIGTGSLLVVDWLSEGEHIITVALTIGDVVTEKSVTITITQLVHELDLELKSGAGTYVQGNTVEFAVTALIDGATADDSYISWHSSLDGDIGQGSLLAIDNLSLGIHSITVTLTYDGSSKELSFETVIEEQLADEISFNLIVTETPSSGNDDRCDDEAETYTEVWNLYPNMCINDLCFFEIIGIDGSYSGYNYTPNTGAIVVSGNEWSMEVIIDINTGIVNGSSTDVFPQSDGTNLACHAQVYAEPEN
ncbi:PKD domain-containing protein [Thalassotalea ganghwensis]